MAPAIELQDLPDALLTEIALLAVNSRERRTLLPLISRRWAGLLQGPGPAWTEVTLDQAAIPYNAKLDPLAMATWFSRRAGSVRELRVTGFVPKLPASVLSVVLVSQAASLRQLELEVDPARISSADLSILGDLTGLEVLDISLMREAEAGWEDRSAAVIGALSRLPALKLLSFTAPYPTGAPTVSQLAALRSPSLRGLECSLWGTSEGALVLGALPALESCVLYWSNFEDHEVHVTPDSLSGAAGLMKLALHVNGRLILAPESLSRLSRLAELDLQYCRLPAIPAALSGVGSTLRGLEFYWNPDMQLPPGCFSCLGVLEELSIRYCGLTEIPTVLSEVGRTLRQLNLSNNSELQIDQPGFDTLLALPVLESLAIRGQSSWPVEATRFLVVFLTEWQKLHPGAPVPTLFL